MMKTITNFKITIILLFITNSIIGQGINYQAVLRNIDGSIMANTNVTLGVTILDDGVDVYSETASVTSDQYGLINTQLGVGSTAFELIDWSSGKHVLSVSIDGLALGEVPFSVVPYSKTSTSMSINNLIDVYVEGAQNGDILIYDDGEWISGPPSETGTQNLILDGTTLTISGGNSVNLNEIVTGGDGWGAQTVVVDGSLEGNGTSATPLKLNRQGAVNGQVLKWINNKWVPANDENSDTDDQTLQLADGILSISNGNNVDISSIDSDEQTLSFNATELSISNGNEVDLSSLNTDKQTLSISGSTISISNGNTISIPSASDDWGSQVALTDGWISGNGDTNPIILNHNGVLEGEHLTFDGSNWSPTSYLGIENVTSGDGISVSTVGTSSEIQVDALTDSPLWNANKIADIPVEITNPIFGQVLAYDNNNNKFINAYQLDADFVPSNFGGVNTIASLSPVVASDFTDVSLSGVSGNFISGNPVGTHIAIDNNEIMAKAAEDVPGTLFLQVDGGNVRIGGAGPPTHVFQVSGVARSAQSTWATSSDKRVKKNIRTLPYGLKEVLKMRPVKFDWIEKYRKKNRELKNGKLGFIAQEIEKVIPEMVNTHEEKFGDTIIEDFRNINMDPLFPTLVHAIQDQQKIIENQQAQIDELRKMILSLHKN